MTGGLAFSWGQKEVLFLVQFVHIKHLEFVCVGGGGGETCPIRPVFSPLYQYVIQKKKKKCNNQTQARAL